MTPYALETSGLTKRFKQTVALNSLDLRVNQGEILAILGPNGAGKTTLLKTLVTLVFPDEGTARIFGFDVVKETEQAKRHLSFAIGEERSFYWRLTGRQNLDFFAALYNLSAAEAREKIDTAAKLFGLHSLDKPFQEYSTGSKCRLALARSFLNEAPLLLMDEPTRSLDPAATENLWAVIEETIRAHKKTLVFTTHRLEEAAAMADRVVILNQGKIVLDAKKNEFQRFFQEGKLSPFFAEEGLSC